MRVNELVQSPEIGDCIVRMRGQSPKISPSSQCFLLRQGFVGLRRTAAITVLLRSSSYGVTGTAGDDENVYVEIRYYKTSKMWSLQIEF